MIFNMLMYRSSLHSELWHQFSTTPCPIDNQYTRKQNALL